MRRRSVTAEYSDKVPNQENPCANDAKSGAARLADAALRIVFRPGRNRIVFGANFARTAARQRRNPAVRLACAPVEPGFGADHPALQGGLLEQIDIALVEGLLDHLLVAALTFKRRIAERPVLRMVGDQRVEQ